MAEYGRRWRFRLDGPAISMVASLATLWRPMDSAAWTVRPFRMAKPVLSFAVLAAFVAPDVSAQEHIDLGVVHRIKSEAFEGSKVMDTLFWLTDANGPRLTNSPGLRSAQDWAVRTLQGWGATNPRLEKWGTFGRGWSMSRFSASMVAPTYTPLLAIPKAWSGGTEGALTADVVLAPLFLPSERAEMGDLSKVSARIKKYSEEHKGQFRGKVVLLEKARELELPSEVPSTRYDDAK